ncbi:MAG: hypothetical protein U1A77_01655 [Pirellulales bacterium]
MTRFMGVKQGLLWAAFLMFAGMLTSSANLVRAESGHPVECTVDVTVEIRGSTGAVTSTQTYQQSFLLDEGGVFFEDFSTRTRFKFLTVTSTKVDGDTTIAMNWFADVSVFNSVDLDTSVLLGDGSKKGQATGRHTLYVSGGSTTTIYTLTCVER